MKSRVCPQYKTKYLVSNWAEYNRVIVWRGDITLWISTDAIDAWQPSPSGKQGGQRKFSDHVHESNLESHCLTLYCVHWHSRLRSTHLERACHRPRPVSCGD
ncbi:MAG: transposase [Deltaproteobacteria bacterium]|nr:transposase [Deltaproteobacteria bacterium]